MLRISGLHLPLDFKEIELRRAAAKRLRLSETEVREVGLFKKSVDARKKDNIVFVCTADITLDGNEEKLLRRINDNGIQKVQQYRYELPKPVSLSQRPVVIGFGPAGMFAALILAQCGARPIVLERGESVEMRKKTVEDFWTSRRLNPKSNVQFGEGGAGTFSDGKLTTGTGDVRIRKVLEELVKAGAPEEILYEAKPHVGTDKLPGTVKNIREQIRSLGGEVYFETLVSNFFFRDGKLEALEVVGKDGKRERLECSQAILAIGHSSRDTFERLSSLAVPMQPKAFSVGARIEHPAELINRSQYGRFAGHPALGAADYKLNRHLENGRGVYTFCMCPGGTVTGAASEPGGVVTNGMSSWARDGRNSNAAVLVGVTPDDFQEEGPLAGVAFQRKLEQAAFRLAGGNYNAPAQRVADFLERRPSKAFGGVLPSYCPGVVPDSLDGCLPEFVADSLRLAIPQMGKSLRGFDEGDAVLTAPETRSSSPVRILRGEDMQSLSLKGLYPCGDGAGYAGGIVSAAVDGIRCAEQLLAKKR